MELNILFLCAAAALCTYALIARANSDWNPDKFFENRRNYLLAALILLLVAVIVRVAEFGAVPAGVNQDEAMAAVDAKALADYGTDRFGMTLPVYFTAWGYGQMSVLLSYCMALFIKMFGFSAVTVRLPMLLTSLAGVYVLFRFAQRLFGKLPALIVLAFIAIDPWHIMQSRWSLDCNMFPHFLLFSMYFLHRGLEKRFYLYLSMFFFALSMYAYGIAFYCVPLLLLTLCVWMLVKKRIKPWEAGLAALVYFAFAWPIFAVVAVNYFKLHTIHVGLITIAYFTDSIRMNDLILYSKDFIHQLLNNFRSLAAMTVLEKGDAVWNVIGEYGRLYLFTLPFVIAGLWVLAARLGKRQPEDPPAGDKAECRRQNTLAGRFFLLAWLIVAVVSGLMVNNVNTNRINIIYYPMCMLAGLGIWFVAFQAIRVRRVAILVAVMYAVSFAGFTYAYFGDVSQALASEYCSGFTDAVKYADSLDTDKLYITANSRSPQAYTCSEIYTLFGAEIDARYFQGVATGARNGKKLLPYKQRYQYVDFLTFAFDKPLGSVYVFSAEESYLFSGKEFDITHFGGFAVAVKTAEAPAEPAFGPGDETGEQEGDSGQAVG